tara:strand:- start:560 stop:847 length:288 start_codon:yes stop_codon:yes gene_type:complete
VAILLFTLLYFTLSKAGGEQFNGLDKESSFLDHLYFAFTVQSTVGFGDIYPVSPMAKIIVMAQQSVLILGVLELLSEAGPTIVKQMVPSAIRKMV